VDEVGSSEGNTLGELLAISFSLLAFGALSHKAKLKPGMR